MRVITDPAEMTAWGDAARSEGLTIGFVPTMGFLHDGHRALMRALRGRVDQLVVSIYVNPLQFAPHEDFDTYPRDPDGDSAACEAEGVDVIFMPSELYPPGFATRVSAPSLDEQLCSVSRPHFFTGVATVVARLLMVTRCHLAAFGEKDYQQITIIRRVVADLALPCEIVGVPIKREPDGLAMSSRNVYLSDADRVRATSLSRTLRAMQAQVAAGETDVAALLDAGVASLDVDEVDYLQIVDRDSLVPLIRIEGEARVAVAAVLGKTRLIDNMALVPPEAR